MKIQQRELDLREIELRNGNQYANRALELRAAELAGQRSVANENSRRGLVVLLVFIVGLLAFCTFALYRNKEAVLTELLRLVLAFLGGGGLGWAGGRASAPKAPPASP